MSIYLLMSSTSNQGSPSMSIPNPIPVRQNAAPHFDRWNFFNPNVGISVMIFPSFLSVEGEFVNVTGM